MTTSITITSKGQTTIPVEIRRKLGLDPTGGVLNVVFDEEKSQMVVTRPMNIEDLSKIFSKFIKPGTKPLLNVDEYYQAERER
jgi:bifunctional DNA-binding transcriptional regulator/antitoxin component of YhaV-PrlF toxin-antitoxin module